MRLAHKNISWIGFCNFCFRSRDLYLFNDLELCHRPGAGLSQGGWASQCGGRAPLLCRTGTGLDGHRGFCPSKTCEEFFCRSPGYLLGCLRCPPFVMWVNLLLMFCFSFWKQVIPRLAHRQGLRGWNRRQPQKRSAIESVVYCSALEVFVECSDTKDNWTASKTTSADASRSARPEDLPAGWLLSADVQADNTRETFVNFLLKISRRRWISADFCQESSQVFSFQKTTRNLRSSNQLPRPSRIGSTDFFQCIVLLAAAIFFTGTFGVSAFPVGRRCGVNKVEHQDTTRRHVSRSMAKRSRRRSIWRAWRRPLRFEPSRPLVGSVDLGLGKFFLRKLCWEESLKESSTPFELHPQTELCSEVEF